MSEPLTQFRPYLTRIAAFAGAVVVVIASVVLAAALSGSITGGPELFGMADRVAMVGLGLVGALALLSLARPVVAADADGVWVRNIVGAVRVPWALVASVRFDRRASCAALELHDADLVTVQAIQVVDRDRAVAAVRELRRLHGAYQQRQVAPGS